jgi:serine/threonine protein kinase
MTPGQRIGVYEIVAPIGRGGMGEVYRARDTKLNRDVAIKVLPEAVAHDPERLARFEREAKTLAALNHPSIGHIYGFEDSTGTPALAMELVEGPTLADRIAHGPIPMDEALGMAKQIADALEAAHEQGIIHRDLKPANIKVREDGTVKVLDFGLAKALEPTGARAASASMSPTMTSPAMTQAGNILGTAAYMSPEQAKGQAVDRRSDVWSFGCVLYEMLTGRGTFAGDTVAEVVGALLMSEPDWSRLPAGAPDAIERLLRRCLQKDRKRRLQSIGDARVEIEEWQREPHREVPRPTPVSGFRSQLPWFVLALVTLGALAQAVWFRRAPDAPAREVRFEIATPTTTDPFSLAVSPDSSTIVFVATSEGRPQLWLRSLDAVSARPLAGTNDAFDPFWSPDSRSIAFFAGGRLERIDLDTGLVRPLAAAPNPLGGSWNRDGIILFTPNYTGPMFQVAATGGDTVPATQMEPGQASHGFPQFLPEGRRFLYFASGTGDRGVYLGQLGGGAPKRLLDADAPAVYGPGQVLFVRQGTLFSQAFDQASGVLSGSPVAIAEQVPVRATSRLAPLSASASGAVAYRSGPAGGARQFIWFDRSGRELGTAGESEGPFTFMALSPDGKQLAISQAVGGNTDIWKLDLARSVSSRVTVDPASELLAVWSPDGTRLVLNSNRSGVFDLYLKSVNDTTPEKLLLPTPQNKAPNDWSPDGKFLLYRSPSLTTGFDLWALPLEGDRKPFPVAQTTFEERDGQFSPDGNWVAYQSNVSERVEIYVQPFPGGNPERVSTKGGAQVRWRPDGKELFYIALDGRLMAVPIQLNSADKTLVAGVPTPLFNARVGAAAGTPFQQQYAVAPDGQRFLMSVISDLRAPVVTVILNWKQRPIAKE